LSDTALLDGSMPKERISHCDGLVYYGVPFVKDNPGNKKILFPDHEKQGSPGGQF